MIVRILIRILLLLMIKCHFTLSEIRDDEDHLPELFYFEDYDECATPRNNTKALYCSLTIRLYPRKGNFSNKIWNIIQNYSSDDYNYRHDLLRHGVCVEYETFNNTVSDYLQQRYFLKYGHLGLSPQIIKMDCKTPATLYDFKAEDLVYLVICFVYVFLVCSITIFPKILGKNLDGPPKTPVEKFLKSFSIFDSLNRLFNENTKTKTNHLDFIDGVRFVASIGVIITHATTANLVTPVANPSYVEEVPKRYVTMIIANGGMMVQVYFVISSWLMAKSFYQESRSLMYCLKRVVIKYIRLSLGYALIIFAHGTWIVRLSRGPFWDSIIGEDYRVCRRNWWKNLLYFNNFVIDDGMCMFQSWYLSVDLQFTILGLLILWLTQKKPKILHIFSGLLIGFQIIYMFFYLLINNFEIAVVMTPELLYNFRLIYVPEWQATWTTTFSHLASLGVGLSFGYLHFLHQNQTEKCSITKMKSLIWWISILILNFFPLLFSAYYMTTSYYSNTRWFASVYGSIYKVIFAFGMGLLISGMAKGHGGYLKKFLEWKPVYTLGYFSFGVYLVHYTILKASSAGKQLPPYVTDYTMLADTTSNTVMSYFCSIILTVLVLMPADNLLRYFL